MIFTKKSLIYLFSFLALISLLIAGCKNNASKNSVSQDAEFSATLNHDKTYLPTLKPTLVPTQEDIFSPTHGITDSIDSTSTPNNLITDSPVISLKPTTSPAPTSDPSLYDINDIKPIFSDLGGIYHGSKKVSVSLSSKDIAVLKSKGIKDYSIKISYTQEEPTFYSSNYVNEISIPHNHSVVDNVSKLTTSIIRAAVFDSKGNLIGKIETATYIKSQRTEKISLPVVSLVTNDENLYNEYTGIIPNHQQRGSEWERPVHLEFIEKDNAVLSQDAGIRIFGGSSRSLPQKSFRISARKSSYFNETKYDGAGKFKYALFPERLKEDGSTLTQYDSFVLRNGGNDSIVINSTQSLRTSLLRDGLAALIANSASNNVDSMAYRPVVVILNGKYYGILNMREHESENYVANVYDIEDKEKITVISSELDTTRGTRYDGSWFYYKQDEGPEGELDKYIKLLSDIKAGKYTFKQASNYIDMQNFMEYCAINIFVCNTDWPHNNVRLWKYADGKYKFMLRDADLGMARYTVSQDDYSMPSELYTKAEAQNLRYLLWPCLTTTQKNILYNPNSVPHIDIGTYPDPLYLQSLLNFCLKDDGFRKDFVSYCEKLATVLWTPEHLVSLLKQRKAIIETEMKYNFQRWKDYIPETSYQYWSETTINGSMTQWMNKRSGPNGYFLQEIYDVCNTY